MLQRILALFLAMTLLLSGLAGCGKQAQTETPSATVAAGRYVESEIPLPAEGYPRDMVMLSDGRLRIALLIVAGEEQRDIRYRVFTRSASGEWEEDVVLPDSVSELGSSDILRLSPDGNVFLSLILDREDGTFDYHFALYTPSGELRELPITYPEINERDGFLLGDADFTDDGRLMLLFGFDDLREINLTDGSLSKNLNEQGAVLSLGSMGCAGADTYLYSAQGDGLCTRVRDGQQTAVPEVLTKQLAASLLATSGTDSKITFWQNPQGYLFFTTNEGLYSLVPEGSVTEELVGASKSSFADPTFYPKALVGTEDGQFYLLAWQSGNAVLCQYVFDADMPLEATKTLKIYSLYDDEDLRQIVARYQKAHPETDVLLEVGLTGDDGMTAADALRTLNTEILAGSGPDVLRLDGMSLDSYLEKDVFLDLSDLLAETKTLEQITRCYASDGKVSVIPAAFAIPAIYGPRALIAQITDLDSLVSMAIQARAENGTAKSLINGFFPELIAEDLYDSCSAAWRKADGTLDAEALQRYLEAAEQLFAVDAPLREEYADMLKEMDGQSIITPGEYTGIGGAMDVVMQGTAISIGTLEGMEAWSFALAGDDQLEDYALLPLKAEAEGVFLPRQLYGVLATARQAESAKEFIGFVLSQEAQDSVSMGFPVNQAVFDRQITEDKVSNASFASSDGSGNMISLMARYPSAAERQQLREWTEALTTPALTDRTVRTLVEEQAILCLKGTCTPAQAATQALQSLNLYLSE